MGEGNKKEISVICSPFLIERRKSKKYLLRSPSPAGEGAGG
jgi:hypothetical protein